MSLDKLTTLFDDGEFTELSSGTAKEVFTGFGRVNGLPVYVFAQDAGENGGAFGEKQAGKIEKIYELALKTGAPVVGVFSSNGAYVAEGAALLGNLGGLVAQSAQLSGVVPQIAVVTGVCAGTMAVLAAGFDVVIAGENARLFVNPPFVLGDETIGGADSLLQSGVAQLKAGGDWTDAVKAVLAYLPQNNLSPALPRLATQAIADVSSEHIEWLADDGSVLELGSDYGAGAVVTEFARQSGLWDGKTAGAGCLAKTYFARVNGTAVGIVHTLGGRIGGSACRKLARFVRLCDAFSVPVISVVDAQGFVLAAEFEQSGDVRQASLLAAAYAEATTVKITLITGSAYGAAFAAFASCSADAVFAWENAVIAPLPAAAAVTVLWADRLNAGESLEALTAEYSVTNGANAALDAGLLDGVISLPESRNIISAALERLAGKRVATLPKKHSNLPI
ncbi:MAG: carboxyl transferase [Oscillospiraceae bacterium]|nr:carboxyl transferase [Oscillospiraceae bacterium]